MWRTVRIFKIGYFAFLGFTLVQTTDQETATPRALCVCVSAPTFTVTTLDGKPIALADYKGRRYL